MAILPKRSSNTAMTIFELADRPESEQIAAIEKGLPSQSLNQIAKMLGLPKQAIIVALKFAQRTITEREKTKKPFKLDESERLMRVLRVHRIAREAFTTDEAVAKWLCIPDRSLGMKTPLDMLATDIGTSKVENLASAMIHSVPA
jgi:putative toxin-antitoxin system antitoxin component (TIGR02293 family)